MNGTYANVVAVRENIVAELTDAAFQVASRHGVRGSSVDQEVDLWKALGEVVRKQVASRADGRRVRPESLVAELTEAAYHVALGHGFRDSFVDVQLDFWKAVCRVLRRNRLVPAPAMALAC